MQNFPRLWEPIFIQAMSRVRALKNSTKRPFLCHNSGQVMNLCNVKLNVERSPDPDFRVFLHVLYQILNVAVSLSSRIFELRMSQDKRGCILMAVL